MKNMQKLLLTFTMVAIGSSAASARQITLWDYSFFIDGTNYSSDSAPVNLSLFDQESGLGSISWSTSTAGEHTFLAAFDHDIATDGNRSWYDEEGSAHGTLAAGQSWEIDEPGYWQIYDTGTGNINDNLANGFLDNELFDASGITTEDVAMGLGWNFDLADTYTATLTFTIAEDLPSTGFYLKQWDSAGDISLYLSSSLAITSFTAAAPNAVIPNPEPGTMLLFGTGLIGVAGYLRRKK